MTPDGGRYSKCRTHLDKNIFKEAWAKAEFADHGKVGKRETKAWQDIDEEMGEHMPLGAIVKHFGGWTWEPAVERLAAT